VKNSILKKFYSGHIYTSIHKDAQSRILPFTKIPDVTLGPSEINLRAE